MAAKKDLRPVGDRSPVWSIEKKNWVPSPKGALTMHDVLKQTGPVKK